MKRWFVGGLMILLIIGLGVPVMAHDGWSQVYSPIVEKGEIAYIELLFGNHTNEHASYRVEGKWNTDHSKVFVTVPTGDKIDISGTLFYTGETAEGANTETVGINNAYIASFSSSHPGFHIVSVEGDQIFHESRTLRSAKSFVAVSDVPAISAVKSFTGYDRQVNSDRAELIPLFNPAAVTSGEKVSVQFYMKGEPLPQTDIVLVRRSTSDAEVFTTNEEGIITFTTGPADYYLLRAKPATDERAEGEYERTNYEATMTFTVQNYGGLDIGELRKALGTSYAQHPLLYVSILLALALIGMAWYAIRKK